MLLRNYSNWIGREEFSGIIFFLERLDEMTFPYSLDSYKAPTMSLPSLIHEAIGTIEAADNFKSDEGSTNKAVEYILEEARLKLKGNFIAKSVSSLDLDLLLEARKENETFVSLNRRLKVALAELDDQSYFHAIVESVTSLSSLGRQKEKLGFLAREFVSFLQLRGVSRDHIQQSLSELFWEADEVDGLKTFNAFCRAVYPHLHKYSVAFGVDSLFASIDDAVLGHWGLVVLDPVSLAESELSEDYKASLTSFCVENEIENLAVVFNRSTDFRSATASAQTSIENAHNFFRLFSHKGTLDLWPNALVQQACCSSDIREISRPANAMHYIRDMRRAKAASAMKRYADGITLDVNSDSNKFRNVVNIHGMSLNSESVDIQLVNLWTGLETIVPSDSSSTKVGNVVGRLIPVLMLGYLNRIVTNLLFDVLRWDRRKLTAAIRPIGPEMGVDLKEKFISLLTDESLKTSLEALLKEMGNFSLLQYRVYEIATMLSSGEAVAERLASHERNVKWQLHRIYRARNRIVHAGESADYSAYLVENAHDYFDQTMLFCLELSAWKPHFSTFLSCFDYADQQYPTFPK